jgi:hypothetical protein
MSMAQMVDPCSPERSEADPATDPVPMSVTPGSSGSAAIIRETETATMSAVVPAIQMCFT